MIDLAVFSRELTRVFDLNGLKPLLSERATETLTRFSALLLSENEKVNLTAIKTPGEIVLRHLADCAALCEHLPDSGRLLDVGCGAGFPSLVVAVLRPGLSVTALDATGKKVAFVERCAAELGIPNLTTIVGRAETLAARGGELRESFGVVTARAVAHLPLLSELCLPFVSVGGTFLAMKGPIAEEEAREAAHAIPALGGKLEGISKRTLSDGRSEPLSHAVVEIGKIRKTPDFYPRPYAQIVKKPL